MFIIFVGVSWKPVAKEEYWKWIQRCLLQSYNQSADNSLKKWDLSVSPEGFFRLKKYFPSGKQEFFSFHFRRLKDLEFSGTGTSGNIIFKTFEDDIIVQTYNDPKGNLDTMSAVLRLPVLNMQSEILDSLRTSISEFKNHRE
ncbi:MAG: hypothetical protein H7Y07_14850 [Pyrinomonadaceae bacterium]|nr:hypothetical protein [Sphingobacteriaceae bacterium]